MYWSRNNDVLNNTSNIAELILTREHRSSDFIIRNRLQVSSSFLDRLETEAVLEGHTGCVNCLEWSDCGRVLASGSDDFHIMLWDPFRHKRIHDLKTPHTGNIFSVKFLPKSGNSLVATGAADKNIFVFDLNRNIEPIWSCDCHWARVKRLVTTPDLPYTFWSVSEDGNILQFDIREHHRCRSEDRTMLLNLSNHLGILAEAKCIAINPRKPEQFAIGANDIYARLYDRRMLKLDCFEKKMERLQNGEHFSNDIPKDCVKYYCPGHFVNSHANNVGFESKAVTYLTFNPNGNELLVNMGADHIYLYDLNEAEEPKFLCLPDYKKNGDNMTENPKIKLPGNVEYLKKTGNDFLENEKYLLAIDNYSRAIQISPNCPMLYLNRATALMRRSWYGDTYAALRDCLVALRLDPSYIKAHFRLARALLDLGRRQDAEDCLKELTERFPSYVANHGVMMLKKDISVAATMERRSNLQPVVRNLEISEEELEWRSMSKDYKDRFVGHCNTTTDIKEANFFGNDGNYIVAGSDDGNLFIWERPSNVIRSVYRGDSAIVNCVQPNPNICALATSGIDHEIKIWTPCGHTKNEDTLASENRVLLIDKTVDLNQVQMRTDPFEVVNPNAFCRTS